VTCAILNPSACVLRLVTPSELELAGAPLS
jgi:hypothetical protein